MPNKLHHIKPQKNNVRVALFYSYDQNISSDGIKFSQEIGFRDKYELLNFTAGLTAEYYLTNKFALRSGVSQTNRNFHGKYFCNALRFYGPILKITLQFIQLPFAVKLYPCDKIWRFWRTGNTK